MFEIFVACSEFHSLKILFSYSYAAWSAVNCEPSFLLQAFAVSTEQFPQISTFKRLKHPFDTPISIFFLQCLSNKILDVMFELWFELLNQTNHT